MPKKGREKGKMTLLDQVLSKSKKRKATPKKKETKRKKPNPPEKENKFEALFNRMRAKQPKKPTPVGSLKKLPAKKDLTKIKKRSLTEEEVVQKHDIDMAPYFGAPDEPTIWDILAKRRVWNMNYWCLVIGKTKKKRTYIPLDNTLKIETKNIFNLVVQTYVFADPDYEPTRRYARNAILRHFGISTSRNPFVLAPYKELFTASEDYEPLVSGEDVVRLFEEIIKTIGAPQRNKKQNKPVKPKDFPNNWLIHALQIFGVITEALRETLSDQTYQKFFDWYTRFYQDDTCVDDPGSALPWINRNLTMLTRAYLENSDVDNAVEKILKAISGAAADKTQSNELCCTILQSIIPHRHCPEDKIRIFCVKAGYTLLHKLLGKQIEVPLPHNCDTGFIGQLIPQQLLRMTKEFMNTNPHIIKWKAFLRASMVALLFSEIPALTQEESRTQQCIQGLADQWEKFSETPQAKTLVVNASAIDFSLAQKNCREFSQGKALKLYRTFNLDVKRTSSDLPEEEELDDDSNDSGLFDV